jgi:hypothetical protein
MNVQTISKKVAELITDDYVIFSPVVYDDVGWYFGVIVANPAGGYRSIQVRAEGKTEAETGRAAILVGLLAYPGPICAIDTDDELQTAILANERWPSERGRKLIAEIRNERGA